MVGWLCNGRIDALSAIVSRGKWDRSTGGDHQGFGNSDKRATTRHES